MMALLKKEEKQDDDGAANGSGNDGDGRRWLEKATEVGWVEREGGGKCESEEKKEF